MPYYKDTENRPHFLEDSRFAYLLPPGCTEITSEEAALLAEPRLSEEEIITALETALDRHIDTVAAQRRYDNRVTASLRAGYPGPFQEEGIVFAQWMDECYAKSIAIQKQVAGGERPIPTPDELIGEMPEMVWP